MKKEYDFSGAKRGSIAKTRGKTRITMYLDDDVLAAFRDLSEKKGRGYQTLINEALRQHLNQRREVVDARTLRRILREELRRAG